MSGTFSKSTEDMRRGMTYEEVVVSSSQPADYGKFLEFNGKFLESDRSKTPRLESKIFPFLRKPRYRFPLRYAIYDCKEVKITISIFSALDKKVLSLISLLIFFFFLQN